MALKIVRDFDEEKNINDKLNNFNFFSKYFIPN